MQIFPRIRKTIKQYAERDPPQKKKKKKKTKTKKKKKKKKNQLPDRRFLAGSSLANGYTTNEVGAVAARDRAFRAKLSRRPPTRWLLQHDRSAAAGDRARAAVPPDESMTISASIGDTNPSPLTSK